MRIRMGRGSGRKGYRLVLVAGLVSTATIAGVLGRSFLPRAFAQTGSDGTTATASATSEPATEWAKRPVAYLHGATEVVTMKDLGEYLIKREGAAKLELLVNKMIIEEACKKKGIEVTAAEVDAALQNDLRSMSGGGALISEKDFVSKILRHYNKTLYEWKEDVIRPRLLMGKLCASRVKVSDSDVQMAFDAYYGEKVKCQLILFPKQEQSKVMAMYAKLRDDPSTFDAQAKQQASSQLAASAGVISPFGHHTTGNEELEKEAFALKPGQISRVIETPEGLVVLKLIERIPATKDKNIEQERPKLAKEVMDKKIQAEIPVCFKELRDQAAPTLLLKNITRESDMFREVEKEIGSAKNEEVHHAPAAN